MLHIGSRKREKAMGKHEPINIKKEIFNSGKFHPGKISLQYTVCNKPKCACNDKINPKKHGPYYQLSYSLKGKSRTRFVKLEDVEKVTEYINEYHRLKSLISDLSEAYVNHFKDYGWDYDPEQV